MKLMNWDEIRILRLSFVIGGIDLYSSKCSDVHQDPPVFLVVLLCNLCVVKISFSCLEKY